MKICCKLVVKLTFCVFQQIVLLFLHRVNMHEKKVLLHPNDLLKTKRILLLSSQNLNIQNNMFTELFMLKDHQINN